MAAGSDHQQRLRAQVANASLVAAAAAQQLPRDEPITLRCECGRANCSRHIDVSPAEYKERAVCSSRLLVAPGDETDRGQVLERTPRFVLVDTDIARVLVEVLTTEECPNASAAVELVQMAGRRSGVELELRQIVIRSAREALRHRFLGSPSVRVDGRDVEPGATLRIDFALGCRLYAIDGRAARLPRSEWIEAALNSALR